MIKLCSKCGIVKMKTNFYFRNTNKKNSECFQGCSFKQIAWRDENYEKLRNHKKQNYENNREKIRNQQKNIMMRIVM